ncbi:MAG: Imm32 family immunity protein [Gemmatimonadaceae bacterium]
MSERVRVTTEIPLDYWSGQDTPGVVYQNAPVDPEHTDELVVAVRSDDSDTDPQERVVTGRPQIHFAGTPRALEAFGRYLIALARLQTLDPDIHQHFEDVQNDDGGTVHLIVHRVNSGDS